MINYLPELWQGEVTAHEHLFRVRYDIDWMLQIEMFVTPKLASGPSARLNFIQQQSSFVLWTFTLIWISW